MSSLLFGKNKKIKNSFFITCFNFFFQSFVSAGKFLSFHLYWLMKFSAILSGCFPIFLRFDVDIIAY